MLTRLGYYADRIIEWGWLAAAVMVPLFFNVYSSRVFEPDKIALLRSLVLLMTVAWLVKLLEGGLRASAQSGAATRSGKAGAALQGAAESATPEWLGFLRVPMVVPVLIYALVYLISSIFTMTPDATVWGSYQRLQGLYSQYSYIMLGMLVIANMRRREQVERLITFIILTSVPVALYGLLQARRLDPLPWAGDTATRVASSMGNAIFVAAWLIMTVPFTLYRFMVGVSAARSGGSGHAEADEDGTARRSARRAVLYQGPDYGWAAVANAAGVLLIPLMMFMIALRLIAGLPFPDAALWPAIPFALVVFYLSCWALEWLGNRRDDPVQKTVLWITGVVLFITSFFAFVPIWSINRETVTANMELDGAGFLWVLFFLLAWLSVAGVAYFFGGGASAEQDPNRGVVRLAANVGYGLLLAVQLICIYLTQSRGPWLGLGVGLVTFAVALWLVGRRRGVQWMSRIGGVASAIVLVGAIFVGLLNIPGSPLKVLDSLPLLGRGVERLSTLTQTDVGTGKVRQLIWQGASALIASDPVRTIIGYGPESMYVVYNKFYPPELAHWELRNATPDRSHNVEFDHLVTMGVVGLLAYYLMLGAFFFFGVKALKRAASTRDQLLIITLMSAMAAHFIEIQTGIQIAATWTYFYLIVAAMVVFGYYITGYLRETPRAAAEDRLVSVGAEDGDGIEGVSSEEAVGVGAPVYAAAAGTAGGEKRLQVGGSNGKPAAATATVAPGQKAKQKGGAGNAQGGKPGQRDGQGQGQGQQGTRTQPMSEARRRQAQMRARAVQQKTSYSPGAFSRNPAFAIIYAVALMVALFTITSVNVATVQADTLYKQGQSYDSAQRWFDSIQRYEQATKLQPNQDYYYLFLGRAYLEWSKTVDQQMPDKDAQTGRSFTQQQRDTERLARLSRALQALQTARDLNPLNTDHYANLGRLYLYWSDPAGGNDPSKSKLAVENMEKAVDRSPGNAQLWNELAIAYARNGQFSQAIQTLEKSQRDVDSAYARTPFIRGQLLQERANQVKGTLASGGQAETGDNDFVRLVAEAGKAFSESIGLDPSQFVDSSMQSRVEFFIDAGKPITGSNAKVDTSSLSSVLTDTIMTAYKNVAPQREKELADFLRSRGAFSGEGNKVPDDLLKKLWEDPQWAGERAGSQVREWLDNDMLNVAHRALVAYAELAFINFRLNNPQGAIENYTRAVAIDPSNYANQRNLGSLLVDDKKYDQALAHLTAARDILRNSSDLNTDTQKQQDLQQIQTEIARVQGLQGQPATNP